MTTEQGKTYAAFVEAELKAERERRFAYDGRGQAIVTTSAALVTLLTGLVTLVRSSGQVTFPKGSVVPMLVAMVCLALAAALGIGASWNFRYNAATSGTLRTMIRRRWRDHESDARNHVAYAQMLALDTLRAANNRKASLVSFALAAQLVALIALAVLVVFVVLAIPRP